MSGIQEQGSIQTVNPGVDDNMGGAPQRGRFGDGPGGAVQGGKRPVAFRPSGAIVVP